MKMTTIHKIKIEGWLADPQDFTEGLNLLRKVSRKGRIIARLGKWGNGDPETTVYKLAHLKLIHKLNLVLKRFQETNAPELSDKRYDREFTKQTSN